MTDDLYCKVYLDATFSVASVRELMATLTEGTLKGRSIFSKELMIDVFENKTKSADYPPNDFVQWPFYLEIEPSGDNISFDTYLSALASVLRGLQAQDIRVTPSCDFEDQLLALV